MKNMIRGSTILITIITIIALLNEALYLISAPSDLKFIIGVVMLPFSLIPIIPMKFILNKLKNKNSEIN